jgi:hypothetical protein
MTMLPLRCSSMMSQQPLLFLRPLILTLIPPYMLAGDLLRGAHLKFHFAIRAVVFFGHVCAPGRYEAEASILK